ncbi:uncharacterized protein KZ484_013676 [Pholidichthys leucotaenia]
MWKSVCGRRSGASTGYRDQLDPAEEQRYQQKLGLIGGKDPYEIDVESWSSDPDLLPELTYPDIVNYLVFFPSPYTPDDLKGYKSLDAYQQFVGGWVGEVLAVVLGNIHVVSAKVCNPSSPSDDEPLLPWAIIENNGTVRSAHCTCMSGCDKACSHVCALLFTVEAKIRNPKTVQEESAHWTPPSTSKAVTFLETKDIDFRCLRGQKRKLGDSSPKLPVAQSPAMATPTQQKKIPPPTLTELHDFLNNLHRTGVKCPIFSVIPKYADEYFGRTDNSNSATAAQNVDETAE